MKIYALLNWYEEPPEWLAAVVASLSRLCDGIVAADGAYYLFPNALRQPVSGAVQATTIVETALSVGMSCTIHVPSAPWLGNEVEKLNAILRIAPGIPMEDWYFRMDADELLTTVPDDVREQLERTDRHAVDLRLWERLETFGQTQQSPIRRLYRVLPGMSFGPAHHIITGFVDGEQVVISDLERPRTQTPALDMPDLRMEHRGHMRPKARRDDKEWYYRKREEFGIETPEVSDGVYSSG